MTTHGFTRVLGSAAAALALAVVPLGAAAPASAATDPPPTVPPGAAIPFSQYKLVGVDSESAPYPAPPSLDGTAAGALDGDYATQWASRYNGGNPDKLPHWLTGDVGGSFDLTGLGYSVKVQGNGPVKDVEVYATDDTTIAHDADADWGEPVGAATFHQPTSATEVQHVVFDQVTHARYVKFQAVSSINGSHNASASEITVFATGDTTPAPVDPSAPADPAPAAPITNGNGLTVEVGTEFPQVVSYDLDGATLDGQRSRLTSFTINGKDYVATTSGSLDGAVATYLSTFDGFPGLTVTSTLTVTDENTVEFAMTKLDGPAAATVNMIAVPNQSLVSVDSSDAEATLARTRISTDSTTTADQFVAVTGATPVDAKPVGTPYGFVSGSELAAGIMTNATDDSKQDNNDNWNTRLQSRIVDAGNGARRAELSVGNYTYAPAGASDPRVSVYALPKAVVVLASDLNGDDDVTWQDAAIAYRDVMDRPLGADRVPDRVVQHIPFNFASQATNPFLKTLDNVKRISMATDNLGQWVLEKGYANEGHDSGHPDYGGDYNTRAGGLEDFNTLIDDGADFNADIAVHVNATEAYPQAETFTADMVKGQVNGWNWLNQSYHIDQRRDLGTGAILDRFAQLKAEAPNLSGVYIDAYYSSGWLADGLAAELHEMDLEVATEWAYKFEGTSVWSHWANDKNYGGVTNKGINSSIVRFIANSDRDTWNTDPLLGGEQLADFEGWTGHDDYDAFYANIWKNDLPTKFLQHFELTSWDPGKTARLTDGTATVDVAMVDGARQIRMAGALVANGDAYLLPWGDPKNGNDATSPSSATKMYYFNAAGGSATFDLTDQFSANGTYVLYRLTDQGRVKVSDVAAVDGKVTVTGAQGVAYVLAPSGSAAKTRDPGYGAGSGLVDPGFNAGTLKAWNPTGGATIETTAKGDNVAVLGTKASEVSQHIKGLTPGAQYTFSANVEIEAGQSREVTLRANGKHTDVKNTFSTTPQRNYVAADAKQHSYSQRAAVTFTAPANGGATIHIGARAGAAKVTIDDVRVMASDLSWTRWTADTATTDGTVIAKDDFEGNQPGWGPFVKGDAGGSTDPRTSISILHAPYSQKEWKNTYSPYNTGSLTGQAVDDVLNGERSLKAHEENGGLVYRTVPATVPFVDGHRYTVSFSYQTNVPGQWAWVTGSDTVADGTVTSADVTRETLAPSLDTATYTREIVAGCGDTWVGLRKVGSAGGTDFVLDDFTVVDHGPAAGGAACATVSAPSSSDVSPAIASTLVTTFTNHEKTDATNVELALANVPDGWTVQVATAGANVVDTVAPGETVSTTWVVTSPASAAGTAVALQVKGTYFNTCVTKTVTADLLLNVSDRPVLAPSSMTATASSENLTSGSAEGPVSNVLDGDAGTIWHTNYTNGNTPYPHWVTLELGSTATVNGFGYLDRQTGGQNGRVKDYTVSVSTNGTDWTQVASGSLVDSPSMQTVSFPDVQASYVRFTALNALNGQPFAAAAEMRVFGSSKDVPTGVEPSHREADGVCVAK